MPEKISPHLEDLESESIYILREAAAQFAKPVLLYSVGKDSSVLLHLARKAFFPAKPPFPLLHIDTRWKFREMITFRDATVKRLGLELIVHVHEEGVAQNINPIDSGSALHTRVMKTEALKWALDHKKVVMLSAAGALVASLAAAPQLGTEFLPELNEGALYVTFTLPSNRVDLVFAPSASEIHSMKRKPNECTRLINAAGSGNRFGSNVSVPTQVSHGLSTSTQPSGTLAARSRATSSSTCDGPL